jgi:hypothetical protein
VAGIRGRVTVRKDIVLVTLLIAAWMVGYTVLDRAPDNTAYRTMCVRAAQSGLDGLETARLAADDRGEAKVPSTTATVLLESAGKLVGEGQSSLAGVDPPDQRSIALRDEVTPLLVEANSVYGDLTLARGLNDRPAWQAAVARIEPLAAKLRAFVERHR